MKTKISAETTDESIVCANVHRSGASSWGHSFTVADLGGFQGFHGAPLLVLVVTKSLDPTARFRRL